MSEIDKNRKTIDAYDNNPQFYADMFDSYGTRVEDIDRALKFNQSGSNMVLELGCGNGRDAQCVISKVGINSYEGIDASEGLINLARIKNPRAVFHVKDMREVSCETEMFGIIFSFASVLHLKREELVILLDKCFKILKNGGILYIATKYGEYKEIEIENLGEKKYYYAYTPEDIRGIAGDRFETVYCVIQDSNYGPELVIALKKK